jgi:EpsI family protein
MRLLNTFPARALAVILLLQAVVYYAVASRSEHVPASSPLAEFPRSFGRWNLEREFPLEKEVQEVLRADDTLSRWYGTSDRAADASLFIAFFKTQRYGQAPHSPKNCLPGSGWQPMEDRRVALEVPGRAPLLVNEYIVRHGDQQSVVLYWYQSHGRVIAREMEAKFWLVADAIRYHRSDTALVRVMVPVVGNDRDRAKQTAMEFARMIYPALVRHLPE